MSTELLQTICIDQIEKTMFCGLLMCDEVLFVCSEMAGQPSVFLYFRLQLLIT